MVKYDPFFRIAQGKPEFLLGEVSRAETSLDGTGLGEVANFSIRSDNFRYEINVALCVRITILPALPWAMIRFCENLKKNDGPTSPTGHISGSIKVGNF